MRVAAGSLTLMDALPLVRLRAQAMQDAVPVGTGGMAAILGLDAATVREGCAKAAAESGEVVEAERGKRDDAVLARGRLEDALKRLAAL